MECDRDVAARAAWQGAIARAVLGEVGWVSALNDDAGDVQSRNTDVCEDNSLRGATLADRRRRETQSGCGQFHIGAGAGESDSLRAGLSVVQHGKRTRASVDACRGEGDIDLATRTRRKCAWAVIGLGKVSDNTDAGDQQSCRGACVLQRDGLRRTRRSDRSNAEREARWSQGCCWESACAGPRDGNELRAAEPAVGYRNRCGPEAVGLRMEGDVNETARSRR